MSDERYFWSANSSSTIDDYLKKNRPSIITDDMTSWIWVQGSSEEKGDPERAGGREGALHQAGKILKDLETRLDEIEADDSIPTRAKKGVKSKKAVREETLAQATEALQDLSIKSKWTNGKWLFFPRHSDVDGIWSTLAKSVVEGPLKEAGVQLAKVAPSPLTVSEGEMPSHPVCLYLDNVYDKDYARNVLVSLISKHGLEPSACKSDLYTLAGIDSNHPTKLRSSIWRTHELIEGGGEAIKKMKEEFRANRAAASSGSPRKSAAKEDGMIDSDSEDDRVVQAGKRKAVSPSRSVEPVAEKNAKPARIVAKKSKSAAQKFQENDIFGGDDEDDTD